MPWIYWHTVCLVVHSGTEGVAVWDYCRPFVRQPSRTGQPAASKCSANVFVSVIVTAVNSLPVLCDCFVRLETGIMWAVHHSVECGLSTIPLEIWLMPSIRHLEVILKNCYTQSAVAAAVRMMKSWRVKRRDVKREIWDRAPMLMCNCFEPVDLL